MKKKKKKSHFHHIKHHEIVIKCFPLHLVFEPTKKIKILSEKANFKTVHSNGSSYHLEKNKSSFCDLRSIILDFQIVSRLLFKIFSSCFITRVRDESSKKKFFFFVIRIHLIFKKKNLYRFLFLFNQTLIISYHL